MLDYEAKRIKFGEIIMQVKDTLSMKDFPVVVKTDCKNIRHV